MAFESLDDVNLDQDDAAALAALNDDVDTPQDDVGDTPEPDKPDTPPSTEDMLQELRAERERLQERLNMMAMGSLAQSRKLEQLEDTLAASIKAKDTPPPPPPGPTPQEIMQYLDGKINELDTKLAEAEMNDPVAAPALRRELRQMERQYTDTLAQYRANAVKGPDPETLIQAATEQTRQTQAYEAVRAKSMEEYPGLRAGEVTEDSGLIAAVYEVYQPLIKGGVDPAKALSKAVKLVAKDMGVLSVSEQAKLDQAALAAQPAKDKAPDAVAQRKTETTKRNVAAAQATPPALGDVGKSNNADSLLSKFDFGKMSIDEFMRIPDTDLGRIEEALSMYEG